MVVNITVDIIQSISLSSLRRRRRRWWLDGRLIFHFPTAHEKRVQQTRLGSVSLIILFGRDEVVQSRAVPFDILLIIGQRCRLEHLSDERASVKKEDAKFDKDSFGSRKSVGMFALGVSCESIQTPDGLPEQQGDRGSPSRQETIQSL